MADSEVSRVRACVWKVESKRRAAAVLLMFRHVCLLAEQLLPWILGFKYSITDDLRWTNATVAGLWMFGGLSRLL